ncbi:uncharacterized protein Dsimw501_GD28663 [Drosophila simulans]|nr:uncharacterized protein Dsimw501_GD28663 [Drosophila simulans]
MTDLSLINLAAVWSGADDVPAFRSMRTLRALRPLRAVSRWEGMKVSSVHHSLSICLSLSLSLSLCVSLALSPP